MPTVDTEAIRRHEMGLQRAVTAWIVTGLFFMLLPGTFLGAWNLIEIADQHTAADFDAAWLQAHGHAQIFGWIGSFILGIGFYSLSKMEGAARFAVDRCWTSWMLWTAGVLLRWSTNLWAWQWRWMLPLSAALELAGFILFFVTVRRHRRTGSTSMLARASSPVIRRLRNDFHDRMRRAIRGAEVASTCVDALPISRSSRAHSNARGRMHSSLYALVSDAQAIGGLSSR